MFALNSNMLESSESETDTDGPKNTTTPGSRSQLQIKSALLNKSTLSLSSQAESIETKKHLEHLQIYVFVCRCIAFSNVLTNSSNVHKDYPNLNELKLTREHKQTIKKHLATYLAIDHDLIQGLTFRNAVKQFNADLILNPQFEKCFVTGWFSFNDIRNIFRSIMLQHLKKSGDETTLRECLMMFDMICEKQSLTYSHRNDALSKEELYEMFRQILSIKKYEHQILHNACQLDDQDEQLACVKRELNRRSLQLTQPEPQQEGNLMKRLALKVQKIYSDQLQHKDTNKSEERIRDEHVFSLKELCEQSYTAKVTVLEACGVKKFKSNFIFVVMMLEHDENMLQTEYVEAKNAEWETQGEWNIACPYVSLKLHLMMKTKSFFDFGSEKELAKLSIQSYCGFKESNKWYQMTVKTKKLKSEKVKLQLSIEMSKPDSIKKCGFLYAQSKKRWKKWKERFFILSQVSGIHMVLCTFNKSSSVPYEWMTIEGYTVDYADNSSDLVGGRFFFQLTNVKDVVMFACEDDKDFLSWIFKLYVATGQTYKPKISVKGIVGTPHDDTSLKKTKQDMDRAWKHGLGGIVQADPFDFNRAEMFATLQRLTLLHRLEDPYVSRGWFMASQVAILNEYITRYDISYTQHHLLYINNLLERAGKGYMVDIKLLKENYSALQNVSDNKMMGEFQLQFQELKYHLEDYLCKQIIDFKKHFPYGRPKKALQGAIVLLEQVMLTSDDNQAAKLIDICIRKSALVSYTKLTSDVIKVNMTFSEKMNQLYDLATMCLNELDEIRTYYPEVVSCENRMERNYEHFFLLLFSVDLGMVMCNQSHLYFDGLQLFRLLNVYCSKHASLNRSMFHEHILSLFSPLIIKYMDVTETVIAAEFNDGISKGCYKSVEELPHTSLSEQLFIALNGMKQFILELEWPGGLFADHIISRMRLFAADMIAKFAQILNEDISKTLKNMKANLTFVLPSKCCLLINLLMDSYGKAKDVCLPMPLDDEKSTIYRYHCDVFQYIVQLQTEVLKTINKKFEEVVLSLLKSLRKYDQGVWVFPLSCKTNDEDNAESYFEFLAMNMRQFTHELTNDNFKYLLKLVIWKSLCSSMNIWLNDRKQVLLHPIQIKVLSDVLQSCKSLFESQELSTTDIACDAYNDVSSRLEVETVMKKMEVRDETNG